MSTVETTPQPDVDLTTGVPAQRAAADPEQVEPRRELWSTPTAWTPDVHWSAAECRWVRHR